MLMRMEQAACSLQHGACTGITIPAATATAAETFWVSDLRSAMCDLPFAIDNKSMAMSRDYEANVEHKQPPIDRVPAACEPRLSSNESRASKVNRYPWNDTITLAWRQWH